MRFEEGRAQGRKQSAVLFTKSSGRNDIWVEQSCWAQWQTLLGEDRSEPDTGWILSLAVDATNANYMCFFNLQHSYNISEVVYSAFACAS